VKFRPRYRAKTAARLYLAAAGALCAVLVGDAQESPGAAVDLGAAWLGFADDGVVSEGAMGGGVRWYVSPRIAVGPELLDVRGDNHSHLALTGNLTFDLLSEASRPRATPFLVAGAGMFQTRERFPAGNFTRPKAPSRPVAGFAPDSVTA
jgi:hypothetical protein